MESLRRQTFADHEIIVACAGSADDARSIAERYGARVVTGGLPGVGGSAGVPGRSAHQSSISMPS